MCLHILIRNSAAGKCYNSFIARSDSSFEKNRYRRWTELDVESTKSNGKYFNYYWEDETTDVNPKNWPLVTKVIFCLEIGFLSLSVYIGLAIYTPGVDQLMQEFSTSRVVAMLPLTMFVIAYGIGPLLFSPITEYYKLGRMPVYLVTLTIFVILQVPTALVRNIAGLCVPRFLSGFFASPVLATGAASVCDIIEVPYMPVVIGVWALFSLCGPSLGPLIGAVLVVAKSWRWCFWFMLFISGLSLLICIFLMPETYAPTIMYYEARKLRKLTGNHEIKTAEETHEKNSVTGLKDLAADYLWRPIEISIIEPVVLLINIYLALVYGVLYLWFEGFPLVFIDIYDFTIVEEGACFSSILVGVIIGSCCYVIFIYHRFTVKLKTNQPVYPEVFLPMAIVGAVFLPIGIFIFGWGATQKSHWIASLIGAVLAGFANFIIFQTLLNYLGMSFPKYVASAFASNCLFRSVIAGVFPLFGHSLFFNLRIKNFPVAWGSTILAIIAAGMIAIPIFFHAYGPQLRARSKYTV